MDDLRRAAGISKANWARITLAMPPSPPGVNFELKPLTRPAIDRDALLRNGWSESDGGPIKHEAEIVTLHPRQ